MIRSIIICILFVPSTLIAEGLSDIDVEGIVHLSDGVMKGEVISMIEMISCTVTEECANYRNVEVTIRSRDGKFRNFRASYIDGDWRLDASEQRRLEEYEAFWRRLRQRAEAREAGAT